MEYLESKSKKDFDEWNKVKKEINAEPKNLRISNGEIWWCRIGINVDCEEDGKNNTFDRPVLIFRKLAKNKFYGIPLSTKQPRFDNYSHCFKYSNRISYALLDQMRVFSTNRLERRDGVIGKNAYAIIRGKLGIILGYLKNFPSSA